MTKKTMPASNVSSIKLFNDARKKLEEVHAETEEKKRGTLRGGTSGCLVGSTVIGICHRKALARFLGYGTSVDDQTKSIWDQGYGNESIWEEHYNALLGPDGWRKDTEIPIKWETSDGVPVTGRPDLVVGKTVDGEFIAETGLELKVIAAANSAAGMFYENKPKTENLIQSAHYSMELDIPFILVYSYNGKCDIPWWAKKKFNVPKSERHVSPFKREFNLGWEDGKLYYIDGLYGKRHETDITMEGIREYYDLISDMKNKKDLYQRFRNKDFQGKAAPFDMCNYCEWSDACDQGEYDYDTWVDFVSVRSDK